MNNADLLVVAASVTEATTECRHHRVKDTGRKQTAAAAASLAVHPSIIIQCVRCLVCAVDSRCIMQLYSSLTQLDDNNINYMPIMAVIQRCSRLTD